VIPSGSWFLGTAGFNHARLRSSTEIISSIMLLGETVGFMLSSMFSDEIPMGITIIINTFEQNGICIVIVSKLVKKGYKRISGQTRQPTRKSFLETYSGCVST
jgi:hypothetical protein